MTELDVQDSQEVVKNDPYKKQTCRYCDDELPKPFLSLGDLPLANSYVKQEEKDAEEFTCPLQLVFCENCCLVQLSHVVPPEKMFTHYLYVSSTTQTFRDHFAAYAESVRSRFDSAENRLAVDIGSNDGLLLSCYQKQGFQAVGVDPAKNLSDAANEKGLTTINRFFDKESVDEIIEKYGKASVVSGNNVFAHIDDVKSVCKNVSNLLTDDGVFVVEFPYLPVMLDKLVFDMIYHEHLSYIGVMAIDWFLNQNDFEVFDIEEVDAHGGAIRVYSQKVGGKREVTQKVHDLLLKEQKEGVDELKTYEIFADEVTTIKDSFCTTINKLRSEGKRIIGYGAPAKASTIFGFYNLDDSQIEFVIDDNPLKQGYLVPGVKIPICSSEILEKESVDVIVIFAWNFAKEILAKIGHLREKGVQFLLPVPNPEKELDLKASDLFEV